METGDRILRAGIWCDHLHGAEIVEWLTDDLVRVRCLNHVQRVTHRRNILSYTDAASWVRRVAADPELLRYRPGIHGSDDPLAESAARYRPPLTRQVGS